MVNTFKIKHSFIFIIFISTCVLSSCGDSGDTFSASKAKKIVSKEYERQQLDDKYATITTGYFECNDEYIRYIYRQLAANDVITYNCEKIKKVERVRKQRQVIKGLFFRYYDTEYYYVTDTTTAYFISVELTEKGRQFAVDSIPQPKPKDDEDLMINRELDSINVRAVYPESKVQYEEFATPEKKEEADTADTSTTPHIEKGYAQDDKDNQKNEKIANEYDTAKQREHTKDVYVKSHKIRILKARNVILNTFWGTPMAEAEIVTEVYDVTPFGRILSGAIEKHRSVTTFLFIYYQDKGWAISDGSEIKNFGDKRHSTNDE